MSDIGITEAIYLIISRDALIVLVILIERIRSQYKELFIRCCANILQLIVSQMILPSTYLGM